MSFVKQLHELLHSQVKSQNVLLQQVSLLKLEGRTTCFVGSQTIHFMLTFFPNIFVGLLCQLEDIYIVNITNVL